MENAIFLPLSATQRDIECVTDVNPVRIDRRPRDGECYPGDERDTKKPFQGSTFLNGLTVTRA